MVPLRSLRRIGAGQLVAVLRFTGTRTLSLVLYRPDRRTLRFSGGSPLRVAQPASEGPITLVVRGRGARASYRLTLSYTRP